MESKQLKREPNLSFREKEALVEGVIKRKQKVFGDPQSADYGTQREESWDQITKEVNAVNSTGNVRK